MYEPTWSSDTLDQCTSIHWSGVNDSKLFDGIILSMALSSICGGMDLHRLGDQRTLYVEYNIKYTADGVSVSVNGGQLHTGRIEASIRVSLYTQNRI